MAQSYTVELQPEARALMQRMGATEGMLKAVAKSMDKQNSATIDHIRKEHMTGVGPFPVEQHKLGVRTNRLRGAIWASRATIVGGRVDSAIGDNVKYAAIHEFGGRVKVGARARTLRFKTEFVRGQKEKRDKKGNLIQAHVDDSRRLAKQKTNANLWVFARAKDKHAQTATVNQAAYEFDMPARAPIQTGIQEKLPEYGASLSAAIVDFWNGKA